MVDWSENAALKFAAEDAKRKREKKARDAFTDAWAGGGPEGSYQVRGPGTQDPFMDWQAQTAPGAMERGIPNMTNWQLANQGGWADPNFVPRALPDPNMTAAQQQTYYGLSPQEQGIFDAFVGGMTPPAAPAAPARQLPDPAMSLTQQETYYGLPTAEQDAFDAFIAGVTPASAPAAPAPLVDEWDRPLNYLPKDPNALKYLQGLETQYGAPAGNTPAQKEAAIAQAALDAGMLSPGAFNALTAQAAGGTSPMNINDAATFGYGPESTPANPFIMSQTELAAMVNGGLGLGGLGGGGLGGGGLGGGDPIGPVDPVETFQTQQEDLVDDALEDRKNYIQAAVDAGLIDIVAAKKLWDDSRFDIMLDFKNRQQETLNRYTADQTQRNLELADFREGLYGDIDQSLVADEFDLANAIYSGGNQERGAYLQDLANIGLMDDQILNQMGLGIFGGYEQDLRSQGRDMRLAAELGSVGELQEIGEQALYSDQLAPFFGTTPEMLAAGLASGIDIPGMQYGTSEREAAQGFSREEREFDQAFRTGERLGSQEFASGQADLDRTFVNPFTGQVQDKFAAQLQAQGINPLTGREYGFDVKSGLSAAQQLQQQQFNAANLINPETGLQYGFDTGTGLTAAQGLAQQNIIANLMAQGVDVGGTGRLIGFDEESGLSAAEQLAQENFFTNLTAQGIDMRETVIDSVTGYPMNNPNFGLDYSFDTETGLSFDEKIAQGTLDLAINQMEADEQADLLEALGGSEGSPSDNIMANLMSVASNPAIEAEFEAISGATMDEIIKDVRQRLGVLGATKYTNENVAFALIEEGYGSLVEKLLNMNPMATLGTDEIELMGGQEPVGPKQFGPDVGQSESEILYPESSLPDTSGVLPTGQRIRGTQHPQPGGEVVTPQTPVYSDAGGTVFTQADLDKIEANMPQGGIDAPWLDQIYEPGVLGYIDWAAQVGYEFERKWNMGTQTNEITTGVARERP